MGIFDRFKAKPEPQINKMYKRSYAAAAVSRLFSDFATSDQSADGELQHALPKLRARSRELARNNEYAKNYLNLLKKNIIGTRGFTLQVKAQDSLGNLDINGNQSVEDAFSKWGKLGNCTADGKYTWVDLQKLVMESLARDGEAFIIKHRGRDFKDSFALEFIEADQVDETLNKRLSNGVEIRMGVELNKFRRPIAYHILTSHPTDYVTVGGYKGEKKHVRVPADQVIHVYLPLRAGQTRGEPWMAPAMSAMKQLDGFREAAVINARVGASKMGFFTSPAGDGFMADEMDGHVPIMSAEPASFHQLPEGVSFQSFEPQFPNNEFESFHKAVLKGIASGLGVSYTALANDLESTSYSSIRQGALEERSYYEEMQGFLINHFIRPVFESWLSAAMEINSFGIPLAAYDKFAESATFRGRGWSWIDPVKEMNSAVLGLKSGILSLSDVAAQYGKDAEELLAQIQRDKATMEQFGVDYALEPYCATMSPVAPEGYESEQ